MLSYVSWISRCLLQSPSSINRVVCLQRCLQRAMEKAARQTPALLHHPVLPPASHAPVKTARSKSRLPIYTRTHTCTNMSLPSCKRWDRKWLSRFPLQRQTDHTASLTLWWIFLRGRVDLHRAINDAFCVDPFLSVRVLVWVRWGLSRCWFLLLTCSLGAQSCLGIINVDTSWCLAHTSVKAVVWKHANVSLHCSTDMTQLKACL